MRRRRRLAVAPGGAGSLDGGYAVIDTAPINAVPINTVPINKVPVNAVPGNTCGGAGGAIG